MEAIDMSGLLKRGPGIFPGDVHLSQENCNISFSDVLRQNTSWYRPPMRFVGPVLPKLPVDDGPAVSLYDTTVSANNDSLDEAFVDEYLSVKLSNVLVLPKDGFELAL